jgi:hypothetical protein
MKFATVCWLLAMPALFVVGILSASRRLSVPADRSIGLPVSRQR